MIYLDHAATTPLRPGVVEVMAPFLDECFGNPSGAHGVSRGAKNALEEAREGAAGLLGARPMEIVFTGGGTEADNLAVVGRALAGGSTDGVVTVATEHDAVLESARFVERLGGRVAVIGVDRYGLVEPDEIAGVVDPNTVLVSVMAANNETGTIQPIKKVVESVKGRRPEVVVHTDAVQAFNTEPLDVDELGVDLLSLAAHKFGGPKGVGLLYVREGTALEPVLHGGGQELGRRSGTHNVAGVVGMVHAMAAAHADRDEFRRRVTDARNVFESALGEWAIRTIPAQFSLPQHSHLQFPGVNNETLLVNLDLAGVACSAASACQSGATTVSHVLGAMGLAVDAARSSLRFSFGWNSTTEEAMQAARLIREVLP